MTKTDSEGMSEIVGPAGSNVGAFSRDAGSDEELCWLDDCAFKGKERDAARRHIAAERAKTELRKRLNGIKRTLPEV